MAQFDVHRNTGPSQDAIPFVVVVQSVLFDDYRRRVVVPLVRRAILPEIASARVNPTFRVHGQDLVLHPLEIVSVARDRLGEHVGSLAARSDAILAALDEVLTRAFG